MFKSKTQSYTPVNNNFIDNYMVKARGEFVKVYILGLKYCLSGEIGINSTILASTLSMLETDIMNAWNYWNDEGVIKITPVDNMGNYNIDFIDLSDETPGSEKKSINLLEELSRSSVKDMLLDIEKLIARPLSSKEMSMYISWQKDMNFSQELILLLIQYCASKGKNDSRYIEKIALSWHDAKITDIDAAQSYIKKHEDKWINIRKILSYLGIKDADVMKPQEDILNKWLNIYNFSLELIFKASDICFERLNRADFKYIDAILTNWHEEGINTLEDVALKDSKKLPFKKTKQNKQGNFNNYEQRSYDFDQLEKNLLGWQDNSEDGNNK